MSADLKLHRHQSQTETLLPNPELLYPSDCSIAWEKLSSTSKARCAIDSCVGHSVADSCVESKYSGLQSFNYSKGNVAMISRTGTVADKRKL